MIKMMIVLWSLLFYNSNLVNTETCLSSEEMKLYKLLNEYRKQHNLPSIPLSASLCMVAQTHVKDLVENGPAQGNCNMHSWSAKGKWTSCCYTSDHKKAECMWNKPKEIADFEGTGYEIAHGGDASYTATATSSLDGWKNSKPHNNVILNKETWKDLKWKSVGVGIKKNYAVIWFSDTPDSKAAPEVCK